MKKTTLQRACVGLVFVAALLIKIPLANAQQKAFVFPEVADAYSIMAGITRLHSSFCPPKVRLRLSHVDSFCTASVWISTVKA